MSNIDDALRAQRSRDEYRRRQDREDREEQARLRAAAPASALNPIDEPLNNPVRIVDRPQSPDYPPPDLDPRSPPPSRPNTPPRPPYRLDRSIENAIIEDIGNASRGNYRPRAPAMLAAMSRPELLEAARYYPEIHYPEIHYPEIIDLRDPPLNPHVLFPEPLPVPAREQSLRNKAEYERFIDVANQLPNPPDEFLCPISREIMFDPVVASDGRTYERLNIHTWLETNDTSPMTREKITDKTLRINFAIKSAIEGFINGSLVKGMVGNSVDMLMKKINDGKAEDTKIKRVDAILLLDENDFNVEKAFKAYMMTQGGRKGGTRRNLRKKPRNQRKNKTKKRK